MTGRRPPYEKAKRKRSRLANYAAPGLPLRNRDWRRPAGSAIPGIINMSEGAIRTDADAMALSAIDVRDFCKAAGIPQNGSIEKLAMVHAAFEMLRLGRRDVDIKAAAARACHEIASVTDNERVQAERLLSSWDRSKS